METSSVVADFLGSFLVVRSRRLKKACFACRCWCSDQSAPALSYIHIHIIRRLGPGLARLTTVSYCFRVFRQGSQNREMFL